MAIKLLDCILSILFGPPVRLRFDSIVTQEGLMIKGKIKMVKFELDQFADFTAVPVDRRGRTANIEPGSASWSFSGTDADGNDVSDTVIVAVDPTNELSVRVTSTSVELTGVLTLRADGDPDSGEYAPVVATADIIVDASNAVAVSLSNTTPADV